jgi:hypothetical protein
MAPVAELACWVSSTSGAAPRHEESIGTIKDVEVREIVIDDKLQMHEVGPGLAPGAERGDSW